MAEASPEDGADGIGKVGEQTTDGRPEHDGLADVLEAVHGEHEADGDDGAEEALGEIAFGKDGDEFLHAFFCCRMSADAANTKDDNTTEHTTINNTNIHSKRISREVSDIPRVVTKVAKADDPMRNSRPNACPSNDLWVNADIVQLDNVVDGVIE